MWSADFWRVTADKAIKTFLQVLGGFLAADIALWDVPWSAALGVAASSALLSVIMSVTSAPEPYVGQHRRTG